MIKQVFTGNAFKLRTVLIQQIEEMSRAVKPTGGDTYGDGIDAGEVAAYRRVVYFLRKLEINPAEEAQP